MAKIMIVDDSRFIRQALKHFLEAGNHQVVFEANDGEDAVDAYTEVKPDLVTMDISMPGMNGITALKKIMQMDPSAKVIMISSLNQKDLVVQVITYGAKNYILKPWDKDKTYDIIRDVLNDGNATINSCIIFYQHYFNKSILCYFVLINQLV